MNIIAIGIDIAKNIFQIHGVDHKGKCVLQKKVTRGKLLSYIAPNRDIDSGISRFIARNTLDGMETMRMIQKGEVRKVGKNVVKQNQFVRSLFGIAA